MPGERSVIGAGTTTSKDLTAVWAIARPASSQSGRKRRAMEKTRTTSAWKTPLAFPTFPQLRLLLLVEGLYYQPCGNWGQVNWMYRMHGRWFKLSIETFDAIHYAGLSVYKIGIILLNLVPLVALYLVS